jgi:hypothetical protein
METRSNDAKAITSRERESKESMFVSDEGKRRGEQGEEDDPASGS